MVSIFVDGQDKTRQISDWDIRCKQDELTLTCHFPSGKKLWRPIDQCRVEPTRELENALLRKKGSSAVRSVDQVVIYGEKYAVVRYGGNPKQYVFLLEKVEFLPATCLKAEPVFVYFQAVAQVRAETAVSEDKKIIADNIVRQLGALPACADTALHAYCAGINGQREPPGSLIFPFGLNESQLVAVERAFSSQVSVIEGPPGTGKTQTILNIIANVLLQDKTVAVVSNNNAAVRNVYEKLGKCGLDYLVAKLGSTQNREEFFAELPRRPATPGDPAPDPQAVQTILRQLKQNLSARNAVAQLQSQIEELEIERSRLLQWQGDNGVSRLLSLDRYKLSPQKTTDLLAYLNVLGSARIGIRQRLEFIFRFGIFRIEPFDTLSRRRSVLNTLQLHFYDKALQEKRAALTEHQHALQSGKFDMLLHELTSSSMSTLKQHLASSIPDDQDFRCRDYRDRFDDFVQRYPIMGSSTHSIVNSLGKGTIVDYLIIDEASQQDIVPGILALGCARNLIVVGDRKQLAHIPVQTGERAPAPHYDCEKYSLLDSCISVFRGSVPMTLLKEHYRCHPRIIQFCNQQFYDNQLIPMTRDSGDQPLTLLVTAKGNHARQNTNLRELDSLLMVLKQEGEGVWEDENGRGFIAPFRAQARLSSNHLPADFVSDTVHKFQGRECDEIVFSTVLDKRASRFDFVDDPQMVNVAVSRAKYRFILVTGEEVFTRQNGPIAALIRYMEYYAGEGQVHRAPVVSAFDLLYKEYDQSLERLNARLRPEDSRYKSERIVAQLLRETLEQAVLGDLMFHTQVPLIQVVSAQYETLSAREREFMEQRASCDFVVYFKVGKKPVGVIEVDGGDHDKAEQIERDALKNSILRKGGLPLLRLRTVESHIEEKLAAFLAQWASNAAEEPTATRQPVVS